MQPTAIVHMLQWGRDQLIAELRHGRNGVLGGLAALQWGRDQLIAELAHWRDHEWIEIRLQWGRDQLIAELAARYDQRGAQHIASMGPRSIDRGTPPAAGLVGPYFGLQWGRDQLIAELQRRERDWQGEEMLQWGRDQLIAELRRRASGRQGRIRGFNGAAIN